MLSPRPTLIIQVPCTDADGGNVAFSTLTFLFSIIPLNIVVFTTPICRKPDCQRKKFQNFSAKMTKPCTLPFTNLTEQKLHTVFIFWLLTIYNDIIWHKEKDKREGPPGLQ